MSEIFSPESAERNIKEEALAANRKLVERGITSPDDWDIDDPEMAEAKRLQEEWEAQQGDDERGEFEKIKFGIDAGFNDPSYLNYTLAWLAECGKGLGKDPDDADLTQLRQDYADELRKIRRTLGDNEESDE